MSGPWAITLAVLVGMVLTPAVLAQGCAQDKNVCNPEVPCVPRTALPYPANCRREQLCIAPYEWVDRLACFDDTERYNNETCECVPGAPCRIWSCPPAPTDPPTRGNISEPCFAEGENRACTNATRYETIPDRNYCTRYWKCWDGVWGLMSCPLDDPYYDISEATAPIPCNSLPAVCALIPFDECTDAPIPTTASPTTTAATTTLAAETTTKLLSTLKLASTTTESPTTTVITSEATTTKSPTTIQPETTSQPETATQPKTNIQPKTTSQPKTPTQPEITTQPETTTKQETTTIHPTTLPDEVTTIDMESTEVATTPMPPEQCQPDPPCTQGRKISEPSDCEKYQQCIGPYEWYTTDTNCGGENGPFDPNLGICYPSAPCLNITCTPVNITAPSEPCFIDGRFNECSNDAFTVPDKATCTNYYQCTANTWVETKCPDEQPFFDIDSSNRFESPPCSNNIARCDSIPFSNCKTDER